MDLSNMSLAQLRELGEQVAIQIQRQQKQEHQRAVESIYAIAHSLGVPLAELLKTKPARAPSSTPSKIYRDPANPDNRWIGKGPRPQWLKKAIADGKTLESFLVES